MSSPEIIAPSDVSRFLCLGNVRNSEDGKALTLSRMRPRLRHAGLPDEIQTAVPEICTRGILPEVGAVIFDEAHELESVAGSFFGVAVSNAPFEMAYPP